MTVEILYFDGCPHYEAARELVEQVGEELGVSPHVRLVNVPDAESARRLRFLGSPTIRVNGRDIEPGADARSDFAFGCRVYETGAGVPDERQLRDALAAGG